MRNRKLKNILYFLDSFPRLSETFIINEISEVKKLGINVKIFSLLRINDGNVHKEGKLLEKETYYFSPLKQYGNLRLLFAHLPLFLRFPITYLKTLLFCLVRRHKGLFWFFRMSAFYALIISKFEVDHIHSHFVGVASEYAMIIALILNVPFTFTVHGWLDLSLSPPRDFFERVINAKKIITISNYNKKLMYDKFNIPLEKIEVIRCGIDLSFFNVINKIKKENIILTVARLHYIKGINYLIESCNILRSRGINFKCIIIGEGEERLKLEKMINYFDLSGFTELVGAKGQEEIVSYYSKAKIFVLPSLSEGIGVAAMEALACKLPVVVTNVCGVPELVNNGKNGFLIPPADFQKLADTIELLWKNSDLCQEFGKEGRIKIEREFNLKKEVKKIIKIWEMN